MKLFAIDDEDPYPDTAYRAATEAEIMSAHGKLMAARRTKPGGPKPKLNAEQVAELRGRAAAGERRAALAEEFGVSRQTAYRLTRGI